MEIKLNIMGLEHILLEAELLMPSIYQMSISVRERVLESQIFPYEKNSKCKCLHSRR